MWSSFYLCAGDTGFPSKALRAQASPISKAAKDGWFTTRPVVVLLEYAPVDPWDKARILACHGPMDVEGSSLLAKASNLALYGAARIYG